MVCDKCKSDNIKQTIKYYSGDQIVFNCWCLECGHIYIDQEVWK